MKTYTKVLPAGQLGAHAMHLEIAIKAMPGIVSVSINADSGKISVAYDETVTSETALDAVVMPHHDMAQHDHRAIAGVAKRELFISGAIFLFDLFAMVFMVPLWSVLLVSWYVVLKSGWIFHMRAIQAIQAKRANMDVLVSMGTLSAMIWSTATLFLGGHHFAESAVAIIFFVLLGSYLEEKQRVNVREAVSLLFAQHPTLAHRKQEDGTWRDLAAANLRVGDVCLVKTGETVPQDGVVVNGHSTVDESMFTGEPLPAEKQRGDTVYGGTINRTGSIEIEVAAEAGMGVFDQMVQVVERALASKAPIEKLADRISAVFVPIVVVLATATLIMWLYISNDPTEAVRNAIAVLVIACPCALGIATPAAVLVGTGVGAKKGIFIKDGSALEAAKDIDLVLFDKTGTLTEGHPSVTDVYVAEGQEKTMVLALAAGLESRSEHPLAAAVMKAAEEQGLTASTVEHYEAVPGRGLKGVFQNEGLLLGTEVFLQEAGVVIDGVLATEAAQARELGKTVVFVAFKGQAIGALAITDRIREDAKVAIERLRDMDIDVGLVTGDHEASAQAVAKQVGIDQVLANTLPTKKAEVVKRLVEQGHKVAFIGDGVNDAPALASATLGIAMGSGTDIAKAAGQMVLMGGTPSKAADAIRLSQFTFKTIQQNLFWAFGYNVVGLVLAAFGYVHPAVAGLAMALSSISVLLNSLRVSRSR